LHPPPNFSSRKARDIALGYAGLAALLFGFVFIEAEAGFPGHLALIPVLGSAAIIMSRGAVGWLSHFSLVRIGKISYPLYLWHWPLLCLPYFFGVSGSVQGKAALLGIAVLLSVLTEKFIESPIRARPANGRLATPLMACMLVLGLAGLCVHQSDGLLFRVPPAVQGAMSRVAPADATWRPHECFLHWNDRAGSYAKSCLQEGSQPLVFVWGDSHAAAISPGLQHAANAGQWRTAQYTAGSCPPYLGLPLGKLKGCPQNNKTAYEQLIKSRPSAVVLVADWYMYRDDRTSDKAEYDLKGLRNTIEKLKRDTNAQLYLVGPPPARKAALVTLMLAHAKDHDGALIPEYTDLGLNEHVFTQEAMAKSLAQELGVNYFSMVDVWCRQGQCRTRFDELNLVSFDQDHLTPMASDVIGKLLFERMTKGQESRP
jgi:hypothetical protein